eukprot:scaffold7729_cov172-Amphora_coffeaeformis.AAC.3
MSCYLDLLAGKEEDLAKCTAYAMSIENLREEKAREIVQERGDFGGALIKFNSNVVTGSGTQYNGCSIAKGTSEPSSPGLIEEEEEEEEEHNPRHLFVSPNGLEEPIPKKKKTWQSTSALTLGLPAHPHSTCDRLRTEKDEQHTELLSVREKFGQATREAIIWEQKYTESENRVVQLRQEKDKSDHELRQVKDALSECRGENTVLRADRSKYIRERDEARADATMWHDRLFQGWRPHDGSRDNKRQRREW